MAKLVDYITSLFYRSPLIQNNGRPAMFGSAGAGSLWYAPPCSYGHCTLLPAPWFARLLSLERKRTERSRVPFALMLLKIDSVQTNGDFQQFVHSIVKAVSGLTRETDIVGWYQNPSVVGIIFTGIGAVKDPSTFSDGLVAKVATALAQQLGAQRAGAVVLSCHIFPELPDKTGAAFDDKFYPDAERRASWSKSAGKRIVDIIGSFLALTIGAGLFLLVALAIKLSSSGPVLYRQKRIGYHGSPFTFLKFRSMYVGSDPQIHKEYVARFISGCKNIAQDGIYKIKDDPRVTPLGKLLRKTSIDELPQFWNVLRGDMSLVGPRPPLAYEVAGYDLWHRRRILEARPGLTGLWQVKGRSRSSFDEMVRMDLDYMSRCSLSFDLKILLQTPGALLRGTGAY